MVANNRSKRQWSDVQFQAIKCHGSNTVREGIGVGADVNHIQASQTKVVHRNAHRLRDLRSHGVLELEAQPARSADDQQVEFSALVSGPEKTLGTIDSQAAYQLVQGKALE